jgi:phosphatidylinositol alpha-1,6-mannosyltransferase
VKSLLISSVYYPPQVGGISRIMENLANAMGPERLCCLTGAMGAVGSVSASGTRVYRSPAVFADRAKVVRAAAWGRVISSIMLRERPQAVLLGTAYDAAYGRWLRRWLGLPFVVYAHGNEILDILAGRQRNAAIAGSLLDGASGVAAVSRFTAGLVKDAGVEPSRITVVKFTSRKVDDAWRRRLLGDRHADRIILTAGNLVARKGHDMVIRALPRVRTIVPDVTYLVVGDGPHREELARLARSLGVRDRVVFAGRAEESDLPAFYALADVFIMASRVRPEEGDVEGFGIVYLEASACGKPVIGGRSGGVPEAIVEGVTGLLVNPMDHEEIAHALATILNDREFATRLGAEGQARVARDFTWARAADRMSAVLVRALDP